MVFREVPHVRFAPSIYSVTDLISAPNWRREPRFACGLQKERQARPQAALARDVPDNQSATKATPGRRRNSRGQPAASATRDWEYRRQKRAAGPPNRSSAPKAKRDRQTRGGDGHPNRSAATRKRGEKMIIETYRVLGDAYTGTRSPESGLQPVKGYRMELEVVGRTADQVRVVEVNVSNESDSGDDVEEVIEETAETT
ncbi:hypothetical protein B0H16DRAFT_1470627 [Mycena metata]|uniref:Uncharacterized protein n=1 Tax=Mycena metata TaxID=1033252 RepID=A0AAD7HTZ8_9AGAR|nr:hypothetical protein B0H16DRAFT_1470627 [Mycena metata]